MKMQPVEYTQGCSDGGCCLRIGPRPGQVTNGGCRCLRDLPTELRIKIMRKFAHERARLAEAEARNKQADKLAYEVARAILNREHGERSAVSDSLLNYLKIGGIDGPKTVPEWMDTYRKAKGLA